MVRTHVGTRDLTLVRTRRSRVYRGQWWRTNDGEDNNKFPRGPHRPGIRMLVAAQGKNEMNRRKAITPKNISLLFLTILGLSLLATTGSEARQRVYYQATCVTGRGNLQSGAPAPDYCTCAGVTACVGCSSFTCSRWAVIKNEGKKTSTKAQ